MGLGSEFRDPEKTYSGSWILNPGSRGPEGTGSRIRIHNTASTGTESLGVGHIYVTTDQVRKEVPLKEEDEWWSPIEKLVLSVDMERHEQKNIQLPDRYDTLLLLYPYRQLVLDSEILLYETEDPVTFVNVAFLVLSVDIDMFGG
jgi:hypothetical protein